MRQIVLFLGSLFVISSALADDLDSWWIICNSCTSDADYRYAAHEAPLDGYVFVSNGDSGVSKKFQRATLILDTPGEITVTISVTDLPMPEWQVGVLNSALASATTNLVSFGRDSIPGLGGPDDSVVTDISNGALRSDFVQWVRFKLINGGYFPSPESVSGDMGLTIGGITIGGSVSDQVRTRPLLVAIMYPDGSRVTLTFSADAATILEGAIQDADGNLLPTSLGNGNVVDLNHEGFIGREFSFGAPAHELLNWLDLVASTGAMECRGEVTSEGVRVICTRT